MERRIAPTPPGQNSIMFLLLFAILFRRNRNSQLGGGAMNLHLLPQRKREQEVAQLFVVLLAAATIVKTASMILPSTQGQSRDTTLPTHR